MELHEIAELNQLKGDLAKIAASEIPGQVEERGIACVLFAIVARKDMDEELSTHFDISMKGIELVKSATTMKIIELLSLMLKNHKSDNGPVASNVRNLVNGALAAIQDVVPQNMEHTANMRELLESQYPGIKAMIEAKAAKEMEDKKVQ